jgi:hypothetical protein
MIKRAIDWWRATWAIGLRPGSASAVLFALLCVAAASLTRVALGLISPDSAIFAPYYSATLVAALAGGVVAGLVAAIAGGIAAIALFVPPQWGTTPFIAEQLISLVLFSLSSVVII